ncbi:MAG TPA: serine/threonine-protein kinase, partial [Polyangiales bacterium]|nr:serine/threonine-protein kinase [Polyangiales bacterium]
MVQPDPAPPPLVGKLLDDRYELIEVIGDGGVGMVYRAKRVNLDRMVAVKLLHESLVEEQGFVGRFQREAVAMSRLYHPHCVGVIDSGMYESRPYLVIEYIPGQTIRQLLAEGPFKAPRAVNIALQLLETLDYFHSHHVIHRDLKSENVMLVESSGTRDFVKVLDFGMAKILTGPGADSQLSKIGIVPGTPSAMAPEQIYQLPPDPRIDIYATGILLYEMIVGSRPFTGADMATVVKMQISTPPKPPRQILGQHALSEELEQVVMKALEKDRVDRFGTAGEMAAALRATPEGRTLGARNTRSVIPAAARTALPPRTKLIAAGAGAVLLLGGVAAFALRPKDDPAPVTTAAAASAPPPPQPIAAPEPPPPQPAAAAPAWLAHRDQALSLAKQGQSDAAFAEVSAALASDAAAAAADPSLPAVAVSALNRERLAQVVSAFGPNPQLTAALVEAAAQADTAERRHLAYDGLRQLGRESKADLAAMYMLDVTQANACPAMRDAYKRLRATNDPRIAA